MSAPIDARALGPVSVAARAYRHRGRAFVTAIVKATFTLAQDAAMAVTKPSAFHWSEQMRTASPVSSARRVSDGAPFVRKAEILLDAIAFASGPPIARLTTRLAVARGTQMLVSKHLEIVGERRIPRDGPGPNPAAFQHMPIEYERAFGGLGRADNPAGIGQAEPDGSARVPNVRAGEGATAEPPGYGPISARWPARRNLRGSQAGDAFDPAVVDLADDLDDDYFQASPADQRVDSWRAGDLIVLAGMHPTYAALRVSVPAAFGVALYVDAAGSRTPLDLPADTIFIEPHLLRAEIVFRRSVQVESFAGVRVFGALRGAEPFEWPSSLDETSRSMSPSPLLAAPRFGADGTLVMEPARPAGVVDVSTLVLEAPTVAFDAEATIDVPPGGMPQPSMPFHDRPGPGQPVGGVAHAKGTPWTGADSRKAVPVDASTSTTLVIDAAAPGPMPPVRVAAPTERDLQEEDTAPLAQRTRTALPVEPPPPRSDRSKPKRRKAVWRDDPAAPTPPAPSAPPAPAAPPNRPDAREKLYKKFKP